MVVAQLTGGIGNQLFQYAFGLALSRKLQVSLHLDISSFAQRPYLDRAYSLGIFPIKAHLIRKKIDLHNFYKLPSIPLRVCRKLGISCFLPSFTTLQEDFFSFQEEYVNAQSKYIYVTGYFQSEKYFQSVSEDLREQLVFSPSLWQPNDQTGIKTSILNAECPVSVHIRRGDYLNSGGGHYALPISYYERAMNSMIEKYPACTFFIFSDDIKWCMDSLSCFRERCVFVGNTNQYQDLHAMTLCHHNIIANSSFSWWGAWLNPNRSKTVIAPAKWFESDPALYQDIIPLSWTKL